MAGNYRYISEQEKKLVITMSLRGMKVKDIANGWPWRQHNLDDEEEAYPSYREGMQPYHVAGLVEERCS